MCLLCDRLALCEKALAEYLETKRLAFPRFYFISSADLLDILSKGNRPREVVLCRISIHHILNNTTLIFDALDMTDVMTDRLLQVTVHLSKFFDNMSDLEFEKEQLDNPKLAVGMYSKEREYVPFQTECCCYGPVSSYLLLKNVRKLPHLIK